MTRPKETARSDFLSSLEQQEGPEALDVLTTILCPPGRGRTCTAEVPGGVLARGRERLLDAVAPGGRLWRFDEKVAALLDITREAARKLLDLLDTPEIWEHPMPGLSIYWVTGGPKVEGALCGFLRISPGTRFPQHEHLGDETVLVLQGAMLDPDSGALVRPGEYDQRQIGTSHAVASPEGGVDLLMLAVVFEGLSVNGRRLTPRR